MNYLFCVIVDMIIDGVEDIIVVIVIVLGIGDGVELLLSLLLLLISEDCEVVIIIGGFWVVEVMIDVGISLVIVV